MVDVAREEDREPGAIEVGMRPVRLDHGDAAGDEGQLLAFYDRLRDRIRRHLARRKLDGRVADALLIAPDFFVLLVRLSLDRDVPVASRRLIAAAVAYFVLPVDVWPEAVFGPTGYLDDVVLAATVVSHVMGEGLEDFVDRYWSGDRAIRELLRDVGESARALLGEGVFGRLRRLLERKGVG